MAEITGTPEDDFLFGADEDDTIRGLGGNDFILGNGGNDLLDGGDDNDQLAGGGGDDVLLGGNGNDALAGDSNFEAAGVDTLTGGGGNDRFEWDPFGGTSTALITDVVTDFQGAGNTVGDTLELEVLQFADALYLRRTARRDASARQLDRHRRRRPGSHLLRVQRRRHVSCWPIPTTMALMMPRISPSA